MTPKIELIHWALIRESQMNPRKSFDEGSLKELAESITKQGLLQPITVRIIPNAIVNEPEDFKGKNLVEIVCGARRYRASKMTDMVEVPCIIKEMTDEEAFDAMITENLQRKDVAPMDEARAFFELHKREVSFEELAARFGKSVQFIRLRIKLNDLTPGLIELLEKKELQISHAQELCKLDPERQNTLLKDRYSRDGDNYYSWKFKPLKQIISTLSSDFKNLDNAKFDKTDCETCEFRCGFNSLFSEYDENRCMKPECFLELSAYQKIRIAQDKENQGYYLVKGNSNNDVEKTVIESLENSGSSFLNWNDVETVSIQEMPDAGDYEYGIEDADYKEALEEALPIIEAQKKQFESGELKKVFIMGVFNEDLERVIKVSKDGLLNENAEQEKQLKELQSKDKRNLEIMGEKTIEDLRELLPKSDYVTRETTITDLERVTMYAVMIRCSGYSYIRELEKEFDKELDFLENCKALTSTQHMQIIRSFITNNITSYDMTTSKYLKSVLTSICKESYPDETTRIELKHEDTYLKRKERIDEQIKTLS